MNKEKHVWLDEDKPREVENTIRRLYRVDNTNDGNTIARKNLFFDISGPSVGRMQNMDSAAVSLIHLAMNERRNLVLHGPVSRRLLENLEEFQMAWSSWRRDLYQPIKVIADSEIDPEPLDPQQKAIAAFSGGVDASFTVWRHFNKAPGQYHKNLSGVMLVQGFDLPLGDDQLFSRVKADMEEMVEDLDVLFYTVQTNVQQFLPHWEMNFGAGVAACLHQFSHDFRYGLIGSDEPYNQLVLPWGSNPITTPLLSARNFEIVYDGTGYTRTERAAHLADWPGAMKHLRVCWEGPKTGRNCCKCEKCIRTILNFRAAGVERPPAFEHDVSDEQIRNVRLKGAAQRALMQEILMTARERATQDSWVDALEQILRPLR